MLRTLNVCYSHRLTAVVVCINAQIIDTSIFSSASIPNFFYFYSKFKTYFEFDPLMKIFLKLGRLDPPPCMAGQMHRTPPCMAAGYYRWRGMVLGTPAYVAGYMANSTPPLIMAGCNPPCIMAGCSCLIKRPTISFLYVPWWHFRLFNL